MNKEEKWWLVRKIIEMLNARNDHDELKRLLKAVEPKMRKLRKHRMIGIKDYEETDVQGKTPPSGG